MAYAQVKVNISAPGHVRLTEARKLMSDEAGRVLSYSEAVERLLDLWDASGRLAADVRRAPLLEYHAQGVITRGDGKS